MRRPLGGVMAAGLVAEALLLDLVLVRCGHETISTCVRRSFLARCVAAYLAVHLLTEIPGDPLSRLDRFIRKAVTDGPLA